ncbi:cellulose-binding domain-containing protein [Glycomyces arizonensis]|uniref:cellulose-binding domain-containing protein n=1 Tax=Glycomyces arizonensis TaxID=256035 RepID=UPI00146FB20A|nr:cellulose-binding domain-containing protein [Glycomyces arizonensis]
MHRRLAVALMAVAALGASALTIVSANHAFAEEGCEVDYNVTNDWGSGFQANITITAGEPINGWQIDWDFPSGTAVSSAWNVDWNQSGSSFSGTDVGWNGSIGSGQSREVFGFVGNGSSAEPSRISVNGDVCDGQTDPGPDPTDPDPTDPVPTNPEWGQGPPPADAELSMAYELVLQPKGYDPQPGECASEIHARYWTYGPDGKVYPTWHPVQDPSGCSFGHEHGDDPRNSPLFDESGFPPFGYVSEVQADSLPDMSQRHEDHVGHKVLVQNVDVIQGDDGSAFFPPQGTVLANCDILLKIHQGTHSPDAFKNNVHELISNIKCTANGRTVQADVAVLMPFGVAGGFSPSECPGFGGRFIDVGTPAPADSPSEYVTPGRLIAESSCVDAIRRGETHYDPLYPDPQPFNVSDMDDFWFGNSQINGAGVNFSISPLFYVVNSSRYYDPSQPNNLGRVLDLCYEPDLLGGPGCEEALQAGERLEWDDPRSPFTGSLREYRPGGFTLQSSGSTTVYTDAYGGNVSAAPFEGSIEQHFSGSTPSGGSSWYLRGATRDWDDGTVHAPN